MPKAHKSAAKKSRLPAGSLVHVGDLHDYQQRISLINYNEADVTYLSVTSIDDILPFINTDTITWVNIEGLHDIRLMEAIGQHFAIDSLILEDILNTHQRPKMDDRDDYLYVVLKGLSVAKTQFFSVHYEQISLLLLKNVLFTFKEKPDVLFSDIMSSFANEKSKVRRLGSDYLMYVLMDTIVDEYFTLQDTLDELMESIESDLLTAPTRETLFTIQRVKRELVFVRRSIAPVRELLMSLQRKESTLIDMNTLRYFGDIYDHVLRIIEAMESYRDLTTGMLDIYLSSISNKMNETMKFLTVYSSIFIPLTFVAGVYGMNFDFMPELHWQWAYPALWVIFISVTVSLLHYFRKKNWL
ncbi:MAG: magnesium/cobalt transporter CorA [Methylococcaceae bacterium]